MGWSDSSFYNSLAQQSAVPTERTLIDKILARRNVEKIEDLLRKEEWTREDLKLLLNHLVSDELKLLYFRDWDRYVLGKYFIWLREIVRIGEHYYDVEERIKQRPVHDNAKKELRLRTLKRIEKQLISSIQFAADIFLYLARSSLSLYGKAFDTLLKTRVEYEYRNVESNIPEFENYLKGVGAK